jgi:hypothetical protein
MWAKSLGARTWWAPSTTAISLAALLAAAPPSAVAATDGIDRLAAALDAYAASDEGLSASELRAACGVDLLCASRRVLDLLPGRARLQRVRHPDSDTIRMVKSPASVAARRRLPLGAIYVDLVGFGRKAEAELLAALGDVGGPASGAAIELDLRQNGGGDFERMLAVAAMFAGPRPDAIHLIGPQGTAKVDLPPPRRRLAPEALRVLIGPGTASSAEVLAALLRRHAGATLVGSRTFGKDYLQRVVPIDHDWRLLIPGARIEVPGEMLSDGLVPDVPAATAREVGLPGLPSSWARKINLQSRYPGEL